MLSTAADDDGVRARFGTRLLLSGSLRIFVFVAPRRREKRRENLKSYWESYRSGTIISYGNLFRALLQGATKVVSYIFSLLLLSSSHNYSRIVFSLLFATVDPRRLSRQPREYP